MTLPHAPAVRIRHCTLLTVLLAVSLSALLAGACSSLERQVLSVDEGQSRSVVLLSGTPPPETPPLAGLKAITPAQVEGSLRRLVVEVSSWAQFLRGDPQPFLSGEQVAWARDRIAAHLPQLRPDQRLQLSFQDRFKGYAVEMEVYAEGENIVYRFPKLAAREPALVNPRERKVPRPPNFVTLVAQPGQRVGYDLHAHYLWDVAIEGKGGGLQARLAKLALVKQGLDGKTLDEEEATTLETAIKERPYLTEELLQDYLEKRRTLNTARNQALLSDAEWESRRQRLLKELAP
jgi:hypothetical protein